MSGPRDPAARLTDAELELFAAGNGSPAMVSAARELIELRRGPAPSDAEIAAAMISKRFAKWLRFKGCPFCGTEFPAHFMAFAHARPEASPPMLREDPDKHDAFCTCDYCLTHNVGVPCRGCAKLMRFPPESREARHVIDAFCSEDCDGRYKGERRS